MEFYFFYGKKDKKQGHQVPFRWHQQQDLSNLLNDVALLSFPA